MLSSMVASFGAARLGHADFKATTNRVAGQAWRFTHPNAAERLRSEDDDGIREE
jgi:hypothetical protein